MYSSENPVVVPFRIYTLTQFAIIFSYSTLFLDSKNGDSLSASRIVELIPERDGSLRWFYKNHTFSQTSRDRSNEHSPQIESNEGSKIVRHYSGNSCLMRVENIYVFINFVEKTYSKRSDVAS